VTLPTTRALDATEFTNAMKKLGAEWASLPYSPYGQPTKSLSDTRAKYCSFAGCDGKPGEPSPTPNPTPPTPPTPPAPNPGGETPPAPTPGTGDCYPGGYYCGGDKVVGDSRILYMCTGGTSGNPVRVCPGGCQINQGTNDSCIE
jgi:hypothetical protein